MGGPGKGTCLHQAWEMSSLRQRADTLAVSTRLRISGWSSEIRSPGDELEKHAGTSSSHGSLFETRRDGTARCPERVSPLGRDVWGSRAHRQLLKSGDLLAFSAIGQCAHSAINENLIHRNWAQAIHRGLFWYNCSLNEGERQPLSFTSTHRASNLSWAQVDHGFRFVVFRPLSCYFHGCYLC